MSRPIRGANMIGQDVLNEFLKKSGIDANTVGGINIRIRKNELVTAKIEFVVAEESMKLFEHYLLCLVDEGKDGQN